MENYWVLQHFYATADVVWFSTLGISILFVIACHLVPHEVAPIQSMPWTFQCKRNLDLDFQSVTYATYHTNALSRGTHLTLGLEAIAWFTLTAHMHWSLTLALLVLLAWQALELQEARFALFLMSVWVVIAAIGTSLADTSLLGLSWRLPASFLIGSAIFRTLGHALEDIPPLIATREDRFVPMKEMPNPSKLLVTLPAGYISEFVSAFPPRLFVVQVFYLFQKLGYEPVRSLPWHEASRLAARIERDGWKAYPPVGTLIEPLLQDSQRATSAAQEVNNAYL